MRSNITFVVAIVTSMLAACAVEPSESTHRKPVMTAIEQLQGLKLNQLPTAATPAEPTGPVRTTPPRRVSVAELTTCSMLPSELDDPCAHACEPNGLDEFIEVGTCAAFSCSLSDGSEIRIGGCR